MRKIINDFFQKRTLGIIILLFLSSLFVPVLTETGVHITGLGYLLFGWFGFSLAWFANIANITFFISLVDIIKNKKWNIKLPFVTLVFSFFFLLNEKIEFGFYIWISSFFILFLYVDYNSKRYIKFKKDIFCIVVFFILFVLGWYGFKCVSTKVCRPIFLENIVRDKAVITFPDGKIEALVADTNESREEGLSGRTGLSDGKGMLFDFGISGRFGFWMKDMLFPIDMIWINNNGIIVNIVENALPEDYPKTYINNPPASFVLEIGANKAREYGLFLGSKVNISQ